MPQVKEEDKLLKKAIGEFINSAPIKQPLDIERFRSIFQRHPDYDIKTKGEKYWFVEVNQYKKKQLYIQRENDSVGFSYVHCITPYTNRMNFNNALRHEVHQQIKDFKNNLSNTFDCELCFKPTDKTSCHIDHINFFKDIVDTWCKINSIDYNTVKLSNNLLSDRTLANNWITYHLENATLRGTCVPCNLKRGYGGNSTGETV